MAAAFGGTTMIIDFTVHEAGRRLRQSLDRRLALAAGQSFVDYSTHVNLTHFADNQDWRSSEDGQSYLGEIPALIAAGFPSFKVFTTYREAGMMIPVEAFRFRRLWEPVGRKIEGR